MTATGLSYLPRPTCFHFVNIYGVIGPAAIVVKLDVPSHPLYLDLMGRQKDTVECAVVITQVAYCGWH